jgi:hypothetical protein
MSRANLSAIGREVLRANAASADPLPVCSNCGWIYRKVDRDPFRPDLCCMCGAQWMDRMLRAWLFGRTAKGRNKALRAIRSLRAVKKRHK